MTAATLPAALIRHALPLPGSPRNVTVLFCHDATTRIDHDCTTGRLAPTLLSWGGHRIDSLHPLTVNGPIGCPRCDLYGHIVNGTWITA